MKFLKKRKIFFCSGSDSGISCDDNINSSANDVTMENVNIEKNSNKFLYLDTSNKHNKSTHNTTIYNSKLHSKNNIDHCKSFNAMDVDDFEDNSLNLVQAIQEKLKSQITIKKVESTSIPNKGSINLRKGDTSEDTNTLHTKCNIDNKDEWNKYLLGKSKPTRQKRNSASSLSNEELNIQNETCVNVSSPLYSKTPKPIRQKRNSESSESNEELILQTETCVNVSSPIYSKTPKPINQNLQRSSSSSQKNELNLQNEAYVTVSSVIDNEKSKSTKHKTQHSSTSSKVNEELSLLKETCVKVSSVIDNEKPKSNKHKTQHSPTSLKVNEELKLLNETCVKVSSVINNEKPKSNKQKTQHSTSSNINEELKLLNETCVNISSMIDKEKPKSKKHKTKRSSTSSKVNEELKLLNETCVKVSTIIDNAKPKSTKRKTQHSSTFSKVNEELNLLRDKCVNVSSVIHSENPKSIKRKSQLNFTSPKGNEELSETDETNSSDLVNENSIVNTLQSSPNLLNSQSSEGNTKKSNSPKNKSRHISEKNDKELNRLRSYSSIKKSKTKKSSETNAAPNSTTCIPEQHDSVTNISTVLPRTKSERIRKLNQQDGNSLDVETFESEFNHLQYKKRKKITSESEENILNLKICSDIKRKDLSVREKNTDQSTNSSLDHQGSKSRKSKRFQSEKITEKIISLQEKNVDQLNNKTFELHVSKKKFKKHSENYENNNSDLSKIISLHDKDLDQFNSNVEKSSSKSKKYMKCNDHQNSVADLSTNHVESSPEKKLHNVTDRNVQEHGLQCSENQVIDLRAPHEKNVDQLNESSLDHSKSNDFQKCNERQILSEKEHLDEHNTDNPSISKKNKECSEPTEIDINSLSTLQIKTPEHQILEQLNNSSIFSSNSRKLRKYSENHNEIPSKKKNIELDGGYNKKTKIEDNNSKVELSKNIVNETISNISSNSKKSKYKSLKKSRHKEFEENNINNSQNVESVHNLTNERKISECNARILNDEEENISIENVKICTSTPIRSNSPSLTHYSETEENITRSQLNVAKDTDSNCSPHKSDNKEINAINSTQLENQENTSEIESVTVTDNKWEKLRNKYSDILKCDLNPFVILTRLKQFSKNDWISKVRTNEIIYTPDTHIPEKNITVAKKNSPIALRDVCIMLKDIKYENIKTSKQIKLNRNFNISSPKHRPKTYFRYKYTKELTSLTSKDVIFSGVQLMEGFRSETPLKLYEIVKNNNVNNGNEKLEILPQRLRSKSLFESENLIKGVSFDKKNNTHTNNINTNECIQNTSKLDSSIDTITEKSGEKILGIEKPNNLNNQNKEKTAIKFIKKPDKNNELKCFGITPLTEKLRRNNKMDLISNNTLVKLNEEHSNILRNIDLEIREENSKVIDTTKVDNVKNKVKSIEKPKSLENNNIESQSVLSFDQCIKHGIKEPCTINKNEKSTHHNIEPKKNLSKISESKKLDSQISSSNQQVETVTPKPKHVFKFVDETEVKRPPTRVKLDRPTSSNTFKVPQLSINSSPRSSILSKKHEKELDSISIYAETIDVESVQNDSENYFEKYDTPEGNIMKVNHWLIENDQNSELANREESAKESNNKISDTEDTNKTHKINTENKRTLQRSNKNDHINQAILFLDKVCKHIKFQGVCKNNRCQYDHNLTTLQKELPKLSIADLFDLYETLKKKSFFFAYKFLFSHITTCLGQKRDFNKLISMVKDVLEIKLNSDRAPFIKNIIDALCSTGVAFHSIVEFVYKNANLNEILMNLLRDILLNIIVELNKSYESWQVIKDIVSNEKYDVDNGIIKMFIVECLENHVYSKELSYKVYHDVMKKISDSNLSSLAESVLHNFYCTLMRFSYITEAKELCTRCKNLDVNIGPNNAMFCSPESTTQSSSNDSAITSTPVSHQSALQNNPVIDQKFEAARPISADSSNSLNPIETVPIIEMTTFTIPPPALPSPKAELFTVPPPLINRPVTNHSKNVYKKRPVFKRFNSNPTPTTVSSRSNNSTSHFTIPVRSNNKSNLYKTSVKPSHQRPPINTYKSHSPNYTLCRNISALGHEVNQSIFEKNVLNINTLISTHKNDELTDTLIKIIIENIVKSDLDILWFFQELWNTAKCLCTIEDNSLSCILKTICVNLILHLSQNQQWNYAIGMFNILRTEFKDIFNVKIYLAEEYSYCRIVLIFARIYTKNKECVKAWGLVSETFQNDICQIAVDKSLRNFVIEEILNVTNSNKMWNIGLKIIIFLISKDHSGVDIKRRASTALRHAINSKCAMSCILEFINCIGSWYTYVSDHVFRSIVVHAVNNDYWNEALEFYSLGCTYEIYTPIYGNERCITISNQLALEEIWLMFEIYLRKRCTLGPIKNSVIVKITEIPQTVHIEDIPKNLRQYNLSSEVLRARVANVLNNYIKPAIKIVNDQNYILLNEDQINNHIKSKIVSMPV